MDVRRHRLIAALFPFVAVVGCNTFGSAKPPIAGPDLAKFQKNNKVPADAPNPTATRAVASESRRKDPPKPETLCAVAAVRDKMAENPELSFAEAEQTRAAARQNYQQAIAMDPKHLPAYVGLAKSFAAIDDIPQALAMYDKALEIQPKNAALWHDKAVLQARNKDWDGASASLRQAQKIDPDNRIYSRMLGMTQARAGRFDEGMLTLSKCMKEEEARYTMARMYQHLDRTEQAREQLTLAIKAHPTYAPAREMLSELQQQSNVPSGMNQIRTVNHWEQVAPAAAPSNVRVEGIE